MKYEYKTSGVCSKKITFELDENNKINNLHFTNGCEGNLKALGIILEGMSAKKVIKLLEGNKCGARQTSCADQLTKALRLALEKN